jgi:hypothetical protein
MMTETQTLLDQLKDATSLQQRIIVVRLISNEREIVAVNRRLFGFFRWRFHLDTSLAWLERFFRSW